MKAVVLGGTGHIGAAIARRLGTAGFEVVATGHRSIKRPNLEGTGIKIVTGDDSDPTTLTRWLAGADVVIDCATPYPLWIHERSGRATVSAAVERARAILGITNDNGAHYTLISSFTTLPRQNGIFGAMRQGILEGSHPYFDLKSKVEREVQDNISNGGRGAIIAPGTCFGPFDMKNREQTFIPMLLSGKIPILASHELNIIDTRDVADVVLAVNGTTFKRPIPVFGHNVSLQSLAQRICDMRNAPTSKLAIPSALGAAGLYWMETSFAVSGRKSPWPSLAMLLLAASYPAEPSEMQKRLHSTLRPLDQTLSDAIQWYESIDYIDKISPQSQ